MPSHADRQHDPMSVQRARDMFQRVLPAWAHDLMVLRHAGHDRPRFADAHDHAPTHADADAQHAAGSRA